MRIIDIHTHPVFHGEDYPPEKSAEMIARARSLGIVHMAALGDVLQYGRSPTDAQVRAINDDTARLVEKSKGFISGLCHLNPTLGANHIRRETKRCLEKFSCKGIKLEIANNARDACMHPLMECAERHGLFVLQHAWSMTKIRQRSFHTDPEDVATLAARFPRVRILMAHLTGCGIRGILAVKPFPNILIDTSGAAPEAGIVEYAVRQLGADRIHYGSDEPIRDFRVAIARVTGSRIDPVSKNKILHGNARALLCLP
jgi:predicted TIM-barrel fold metal-dependent hydrolase